MAKFINTRKAVSEIEDLIKNAGERLILVSTYLKLSKDFKELLAYRPPPLFNETYITKISIHTGIIKCCT